MPDGTTQSPFQFPEQSNGTGLVWSATGLVSITDFQRGWNGSTSDLTGTSTNAIQRWPGRFGTVQAVWVRSIGTGASTTYNLEFQFQGFGSETQQVREAIAHYWVVWRIDVGGREIAFQYRFGTAEYPRFQIIGGRPGFGDANVEPAFFTRPWFVWPGVDARMFHTDTRPREGQSGFMRPTFAVGIYAGSPGFEPLFQPAGTESMVVGTLTAPDLAFPLATSPVETVRLSQRAPGQLRVDDTASPAIDFVSGLRGTDETLIEFPTSSLRGIQSVNIQHETRTDIVDTEDNLQRTTFVHPGHRLVLSLGMRFKNEREYQDFGGVFASGGQGVVTRLPLPAIEGFIPNIGSDGTPITLEDDALAGASVLKFLNVRDTTQFTDSPPSTDLVGRTFVNSGTTHTITRVNLGQITFTPAISSPISAGDIREGTAGALLFAEAVSSGNVARVTSRAFLNVPPISGSGQIIQARNSRKLYSVVSVSPSEREVVITPPLVSQALAGSQFVTGENVLFFLQPQGHVGFSKDREAPGVITATYKFREVV